MMPCRITVRGMLISSDALLASNRVDPAAQVTRRVRLVRGEGRGVST
jgi:hypothetical protein